MNLIIGRKPVLEALKSGEQLEKIYFQFGQKGSAIFEIIKLAKQQKVSITELPPAKFNSISSETHTQGVIAVKSQQKYFELEELIEKSKRSEFPLLLVLDSIQDPHNLGAILRTAECTGVDGVIITLHGSASITETVVKTSAGATEYMSMCKVSNLAQALDVLKENGFWIAGSSLEKARDYSSVDYKMPIALVIGNEEKGIRHLTAQKCDFLVKIPMSGKIQSLNVSVAAGVLLFEIFRQRKN
ncbi:MAG: 23S rRNA (guanosine(2251)-2'-O)-methyltransferase RlmB [Ignavibacteriales bacterium]|nr:23S rRNA (guanosine(2251)-2'-O)-methyltransferase RlmB [Ignavibacteriales bacterium]